jgi:hypothetical protein
MSISQWGWGGEFIVRVRVTLRLTVSLSVRLGVKPHLGLMTILYINVLCQSLCPTVFQHPLWRDSGLFFVCFRSTIYVFTIRLNNTQTASISPDLVRWGSEVHSRTRTHAHTHAAVCLLPVMPSLETSSLESYSVFTSFTDLLRNKYSS